MVEDSVMADIDAVTDIISKFEGLNLNNYQLKSIENA